MKIFLWSNPVINYFLFWKSVVILESCRKRVVCKLDTDEPKAKKWSIHFVCHLDLILMVTALILTERTGPEFEIRWNMLRQNECTGFFSGFVLKCWMFLDSVYCMFYEFIFFVAIFLNTQREPYHIWIYKHLKKWYSHKVDKKIISLFQRIYC